MAKLYDNRLAEERISSLADTEQELLGTATKANLVKLLKAKYGSKFFTHPEIEKDQLSQEYGTNDTRVTRELYDLLRTKMESSLRHYNLYRMLLLDEKLAVSLALEGGWNLCRKDYLNYKDKHETCK